LSLTQYKVNFQQVGKRGKGSGCPSGSQSPLINMLKSKLSKLKTALIIILFICTYLIFDYYQIKILKVVTSSMGPAIKEGSLVLIRKDNVFKIGDIASYRTLQNKNVITHRITKISKLQDKYYFYFKGDANENPDPSPISDSEIIGKYFFSIPFLGDMCNFMKNSKFLFILLSLFGGLFSGKLLKNFISS